MNATAEAGTRYRQPTTLRKSATPRVQPTPIRYSAAPRPGDPTSATVLALSWAAVCGIVLVAGWLLFGTPGDHHGADFEQSAWADY